MRVTRLRCEHREDIPCVADAAPRLGWTLEAQEGERDKRQTAYQIVVEGDDGTLWDSGRVASSQTVDVAYAGRPLPPGCTLRWRVRAWDEAGAATEWSEPACLRTALAGWSGWWIGRDRVCEPGVDEPTDRPDPDAFAYWSSPVPYLRREFELRGGVRRATLYATARGVVELELNGRPVGDHVLTPGWTDYRRRIEYAVFDVTELVHEGANALGAILGEGWYAGYVGFTPKQKAAWYGTRPQLLCELRVEHAGGSVTVVPSDASWRLSAAGPIAYSDLLHGERYDARRELLGWSASSYDDRDWEPVAVSPLDGVSLVPQRAQPVRVTEELRPVSVTERAPGVYVFDLGQNMVGRVRLRVQGEPGTRVELRFAEMLEPDGSLHVANLRSARPLDTYFLRGGEPEAWEPRFTFHGFRYVEVTGFPGEPSLDALTGRVVGSDTPVSGSFACSDERVNRLWHNIAWGQRGNFLSIPTDCPQRDERLGWTADAQVFLPTASLNMDVAAFMTKWGDDLLDAQSENGAYPDVAPRLVADRDGAPAWADAGIIVPWTLLRRYGDRRLVGRHWPHMERYMAYLQRHNPDLLWTARRGNDYGDWLSVGERTPKHVVATAYWALDAKLMADMAQTLGLRERAEHYERLHDGIAAAFRRAYVGDDVHIEGDTQTAYLLALHADLLPAEQRARAAERLVGRIDAADGHLSTGFLGVALLCPVLTQAGYPDVAHRLLLQDTYPSWLHSVAHGATTIWERWDGWTEHGGFQTPNMNSFNHYSLGSVGEWLYEQVAGIRSDPPGPAYEHVIVEPVPGELEWARATYRSIRGEISVAWRRQGDGFTLDVTVPPNVTATVIPPGGEPVQVGSGRHTLSAPAASRV